MSYEKAYNMVVNALIALGAQRGVRQIDIGDSVRVRYECSGAEDGLPYQGRKGVVQSISLTEAALECHTSELLRYTIKTDEGQFFEALRLNLEKLV